MRDHVLAELTNIGKKDDRVMLLSGDLGYVVLDDFIEACPGRFINVGIAEQNMTALAAGMAKEGNIVFTYSIGNFPTLRCYEQIRNDVCYHNLNVKILEVGGGLVYGNQGITHHATEDLAVMRVLPNMRVYVPGDAYEAVECIREAYETDGPAFIRLARNKERNFHAESDVLNISELVPVNTINPGNDVNILAGGNILSEGVKLVELLRERGYSTGLYSAVRMKPYDVGGVQSMAKSCKVLITLEEHQILGGLGGATAEAISSMSGNRAKLIRAGLKDEFSGIIGSQEYLRDVYNISAEKMLELVMTELKNA